MPKDHYSTEWAGLYTAISHYQDAAELALLEMPFTQVVHPYIRTYHLDYVMTAIRTYPCPLYEGLYWRLWKDEGRLSTDIFEWLLKRDSVKTFAQAKTMLYQLSDYRIADDPGDFMAPPAADVLGNRLLDWVCSKDTVTGFDIIRANIAAADVHRFPLFADKAAALKDASFVEPLFRRIRKEDNPNVYLKATATLLAYQSKEIDDRIKNLPRQNRALRTGWVGDAFAKLMGEGKQVKK